MLRKYLLAIALIAVLLMATSTAALAEEPAWWQQVSGQVITVSAPDIIIKTPRGQQVTVQTDRNTRFRVPGVENPGIGDVHAGDRIDAVGRWLGVDRFAAQLVSVQRPRPIKVAGVIKEIDPTDEAWFTLQIGPAVSEEATEALTGEIKVLVNERTQYIIPGDPDPQFSDLRVGDQALVTGVPAPTDTAAQRQLLAHVVTVRRPLPRPIKIAGEVTKVEPGSSTDSTVGKLTVQTRTGEVTVVIDDDTRFVIPGVPDPGLDDIQIGDQVLITALLPVDGNGLPLAKMVVVQRPLPRPGKVIGTVKSVSAETLIVLPKVSPTNEVTEVRVKWDGNTRFCCIEDPDELEGKEIIALGFWQEDTDGRYLQAKLIALADCCKTLSAEEAALMESAEL